MDLNLEDRREGMLREGSPEEGKVVRLQEQDWNWTWQFPSPFSLLSSPSPLSIPSSLIPLAPILYTFCATPYPPPILSYLPPFLIKIHPQAETGSEESTNA